MIKRGVGIDKELGYGVRVARDAIKAYKERLAASTDPIHLLLSSLKKLLDKCMKMALMMRLLLI